MPNKPTTQSDKPNDQDAISAGNTAMLPVTTDLFSVIDDLGKQQNAELASEDAALTAFLTAETNLSNATTQFAGPSPRFNAPTWEGSTANPKRASYKKEFTPIIQDVLSAPTAQSDEMAIAEQQLEIAIKEAFQQQAQSKNLVQGGKLTFKDDTRAMQWVADTIISLSGTIPEDVQTNLANAMILRINAMTANTLYANLQSETDYWRTITALEVSGGSTTGYLETAIGQVEVYLMNLWSSNSDAKSLDMSTITANTNALIKDSIQDSNAQEAFTALSPSELSYFQNRILKAASKALKALPNPAPTTAPQDNNYKLVTQALTNYSKTSNNPFLKAFPQAKGEPSWDGDFWAIVESALVGSPAASEAAKQAKLNQILSALQTNYKTLPRNPLNPNEPITDETEITNWVENTITTLASKKVVTQAQEDMLKSGLIDEVMQLFPIPDKISFYETFQDNLVDALLNSPELTTSTTTLEDTNPEANKKETKDDPDKAKNLNEAKKSETKKIKSSDGTGLRHTINTVAGTANLQTLAQGVINNLKPGQQNYVAEVIADPNLSKQLESVSKALTSALLDETKKIVDKAVNSVFIGLSEQGIQGQMISTSYDYQLINRISNYTSTLLEQLDKHYDEDVPANSSESIAAAQAITAASVSYKNYADDLHALSQSYEDAGSITNAESGRSTQQLDIYFKGNKSTGTEAEWAASLDDIADAVYGSSSNKEALILTAEYDAVRLAADAAGFSSNLNDEFLQDRTSAEAALNSLRTNAEQLFKTAQSSYDKLSGEYFDALSTYTASKETYLIDEALSTAYSSALAGLTSIMETGNVSYEADSMATLSTNS
ncbi:hypothetical protein ACFPK9_00935 [Rubritalea spongiae]|uniref:Uncharacterized protein n=1 Tax=Rubritalea spongiae TaxID=430797 RepID=A0ABW5DYL5_9BACT